MKKTFLLFDADHTLLDFAASEEKALKQCFEAFKIPFTEEIRQWYLAQNKTLWSAYEEGMIPREDIFKRRFPETFAQFDIVADGLKMEDAYRQALTMGCDLIEDALPVIKTLAQTHPLYILTNGLASTQKRRLQDSGLKNYFENVFISEEIGAQKPTTAYFDHCFQRIPHFQKEEALLIGDSLFADIQGGQNAGIDTCWFNPKGKENDTTFQPTVQIKKLTELYDLLT